MHHMHREGRTNYSSFVFPCGSPGRIFFDSKTASKRPSLRPSALHHSGIFLTSETGFSSSPPASRGFCASKKAMDPVTGTPLPPGIWRGTVDSPSPCLAGRAPRWTLPPRGSPRPPAKALRGLGGHSEARGRSSRARTSRRVSNAKTYDL